MLGFVDTAMPDTLCGGLGSDPETALPWRCIAGAETPGILTTIVGSPVPGDLLVMCVDLDAKADDGLFADDGGSGPCRDAARE